MRLLVVEDEPSIADLVERTLVAHHYVVDVACDGSAGLELALAHIYDGIILDVMMPRIDGRDVCRRLRHEGVTTPILMLTAMGSVPDVVNGLDAGADDYLVKPFDVDILLARVRSLTRRASLNRASTIDIADLHLDLALRTASRGGNPLKLTAKEFVLLEYLALHRGHVRSHSDIAEHVWDMHFDPNSNVIESLVRFLRRKVDRDYDPPLIHTIRGAGYYLDDRTRRR
jgi:two-component system copper resistance phosphate regulon response regulator CusR